MHVVDNLEFAVVLVVDNIHIMEFKTVVPDLTDNQFAAGVSLPFDEQAAARGEDFEARADNLLACFEEVAGEVRVNY